METIAFSTKSLDWKTRYSFQPIHYARTGDTMISFSGAAGTDSGVHTHDTNAAYNRFYGVNYSSKLSVITNNNPSATKIYEAFSIEGNRGGWDVDFKTETGDIQESSLEAESFVEKEGKYYSDIPKNTLNANAALTFVGTTTLSNMMRASNPNDLYYNKLRLSSKPHAMPSTLVISISSYGYGEADYETSAFSPEAIAIQGFAGDGQGTNALLAWQTLLQGNNTRFDEPWVYTTDDSFQWEILPITPFPEPSAAKQVFPLVWKYDAYLNTLDLESPNNFNHIPILDYFGISEAIENGTLELVNLANMEIGLYSLSKSETNGEDMRGEYMQIDMQRQGAGYYELFAINVDQHQTKLDHSLGQNN